MIFAQKPFLIFRGRGRERGQRERRERAEREQRESRERAERESRRTCGYIFGVLRLKDVKGST